MQHPTHSQFGKSIALYGGAFDPVHSAHLAVAEAVLQLPFVDNVVLVPAAQSPLKDGGPATTDEERLAMLRLATTERPNLQVDDYELRKGGISYSVETARYFHQLHPNARLLWVMGADQFHQLDRWRSIEELMELVEFLVFRRSGNRLAVPPLGAKLRYHVVDSPLMPQSSTEIRRRVSAGESLADWLPATVEAFISERGLYK